MRAVSVVVVAAAMTMLAAGCAEKEQGPDPEQIAREKVQQAMAAGAAAGQPGPEVEVEADGTTFDPPVRVEQLPSDVWYCDLGTVHYARRNRGDGLCDVCGMELSHKP